YLPSHVHPYPATGRLASVVNSRAALNGSAAFLTQILRVLFHGFKKARYFPSGEICAPAISGLPNSSSRSISGGDPCAGSETADASSDIARIIRVMAKIVACPRYARQPPAAPRALPPATPSARSRRIPEARQSPSRPCDTACVRRARRHLPNCHPRSGWPGDTPLPSGPPGGCPAIREFPQQLRVARRHRRLQVLAQKLELVRQPFRGQPVAVVIVQRIDQMSDGKNHVPELSVRRSAIGPHLGKPPQHVHIRRAHRDAAPVPRVGQDQRIAPDVVA